MISLTSLNMIHPDAGSIDDCWNRIGVHGDKSCPLLDQHVHCRNCQVQAAAATRLLDRYALSRDTTQLREVEQVNVGLRSLLLFRLGEEWLALPTRCLVEVAPLQPVHSLPHQRSRAMRGVANVRGALVACLSLSELLGLPVSVAVETAARVMPRMLILAAEGGSVVVQVDEVDGIHGVEPALLERGAGTNPQAGTRFTLAVLQFKGRSVRVLDEAQLLSAMSRSLS
ncbi:chemotaxis protein CheW [Pseudomonas sp. R5(2019)]|uniref:chemotaxis protein CheW n=1 Tax=Pseudomonas sp. R5(2019) TaxID=2697566 RepID=UPI001412B3BA|nr:chemotaxis protein CheW [Pseudomonas sp. R5(2019)]NBA94499.1 chemotaxis protein CheW [Pseudomonas sp. R5(2019)]